MQYNEEFQYIYQKAKTFSDRYIVIHIAKNNKYNHSSYPNLDIIIHYFKIRIYLKYTEY